jgi:hypothetical protein
MKYFIVLILVMVSFALKETVLGQRNDRYESVNSYFFDDAVLYFTNEFASDTASKFIPEYFKHPYKDRRIMVYGPTLDLKMLAVRSTEGFSVLSKEGFKFLSGAIRDTTNHKKLLFDLRWLQVRIERSGKVMHDWRNVQDTANGSLAAHEVNELDIVIFRDTLDPGENLKVSFRNTMLQDTLINFFFERHTTPLQPFLAMWKQDSGAAITPVMFMKKQLQEEKTETDRLNTFYNYWPERYGGPLKNEHLFLTSKVALYFRKPSPDYADNSMEYAMFTGSVKDTSWTMTGHLFILPQLKSGKSYRLLVRYRENPLFIQVHTFYTDPAWYQTNLFYWMSIASLVLLVLILMLFRNRRYLNKEKEKGKALRSNLQSIRAQLNPHFLFNALASIQSLINDKKIESANHYLSTFSDLLRHALNNSDKELIPLDQELRLLTTYLSLEQLRFPFSYTLQVDETIDKAAMEFPSLLLQPVIENAIRHAAGPLGKNGKLQINFRIENHDLIVLVSDNGPGFDTEKSHGEGHGIRLTRERVISLNQLVHPRQIIHEMKVTESGTAVHLKFRNWLQI